MTSKIERYNFKENAKHIGKKYLLPVAVATASIAGAYHYRHDLGNAGQELKDSLMKMRRKTDYSSILHQEGLGITKEKAWSITKKYVIPSALILTAVLGATRYRGDIRRIGGQKWAQLSNAVEPHLGDAQDMFARETSRASNYVRGKWAQLFPSLQHPTMRTEGIELMELRDPVKASAMQGYPPQDYPPPASHTGQGLRIPNFTMPHISPSALKTAGKVVATAGALGGLAYLDQRFPMIPVSGRGLGKKIAVGAIITAKVLAVTAMGALYGLSAVSPTGNPLYWV